MKSSKLFPLSAALLLTLGSTQPALAATLEDCDLIYSKREQLKTAGDEKLLRDTLACLNSATASSSASGAKRSLEEERYERIMIVLSALLQAKTQRLPDDLSVMKNAIEKWRSAGGTSGVLSYWSGVQLSFDCEYRDRDSALPYETIKNLGALKKAFLDAAAQAPDTHQGGPERVLGILFGLENESGKALPAMFGGDPKKAEGYLRKAYERSPNLSANALQLARILIKNGKRAEATPLLGKLKTRPETEWNPYTSLLRFPRPETRADIERAKGLK